ncbi:MAG: MFS transporter [Eubacteriales bacterium]|nr:MFS transporter [Clostridia bacterium]MDY5754784.1 MFS transporter [Eubacteriales bacterium]
MKLNYKRTFLVGLAFFSICAFWQIYDTVIPLILRDTFQIKDGPSGIIMAIDNILALVMLPFFGALSDKVGRRIPFIVGGTAVAVVMCVLIPLADVSRSFWLFFIALGLVLISMGVYRSPAVALMPDVTPKPLRSKANAVINLMGAVGGAFALSMIKLLTKTAAGEKVNYLPVFISVISVMLISVIILVITINEKKLKAETNMINDKLDADANNDIHASTSATGKNKKLSPAVRRSLILILASVFLWYFGYNAITTAFSKYATQEWYMAVGDASMCLLVGTIGAIASYIPIGMISSKIGRKKMILIGVAILTACFITGALLSVAVNNTVGAESIRIEAEVVPELTAQGLNVEAIDAEVFTMLGKAITSRFMIPFCILFLLVGFAWAAINVNSFPMVVEISRSGDIGKYTGLYYTFSMAAQTITPIVSGYLLQHIGYGILFPYGAVFVGLSFITMFLTKHGDSRPDLLKDKLESFDVDMD